MQLNEYSERAISCIVPDERSSFLYLQLLIQENDERFERVEDIIAQTYNSYGTLSEVNRNKLIDDILDCFLEEETRLKPDEMEYIAGRICKVFIKEKMVNSVSLVQTITFL